MGVLYCKRLWSAPELILGFKSLLGLLGVGVDRRRSMPGGRRFGFEYVEHS